MVRFLSFLFGLFSLSLIGLACVIGTIYWYFAKDLPSYRQLAEYRPPVISRIYATDGALIGEFFKERRLYTPIDNIPVLVKNAFIAAEDQNFYTHPGVDLIGVMRAMARNMVNIGAGKRMQGASTITQQVMKNFLLSRERKWERKIKEAILATRFEKTFTKDEILELYLNEIFLGAGTYGVTAAAQTYFGKSLDKLALEEIAFLAALPKGPNNYHPKRHTENAIGRRNYVLARMVEDDYITQEQANIASSKPLISILGERSMAVDATYFVEEIRRDLLTKYGESVIYNSGFNITATIDANLQRYAEQALRSALIELDKKLGWRGAIAKNIDILNPEMSMTHFKTPRDLYDWRLALVTGLNEDGNAQIYIKETKKSAKLAFASSAWAHSLLHPLPKTMGDIVEVGDVVYVTHDKQMGDDFYMLRQIPKINGAFMAMDSHTGRVLAQQGGFSFSSSQFNRATQAMRQPGSSFKPFVYAAALEQGYSPATLVNDGPFSYRDGLGRLWSPKNYDKKYLGNVTMRVGLERSRNLMTIRIAADIGMNNVIEMAHRFGVDDKMKAYLPMSLGAGETTLEKMVTAYAVFSNGGKKVTPVYYDRIQDRNGKTIVTADISVCKNCLDATTPVISSPPEYLLDPMTNYQMVSMLEGVVQRGTGRTLSSLGVPIAGKTGTTNESKDVWFLGFTSNMVFGTYIGYDDPKPMGKLATGGGTAAPIVKEFLTNALEYGIETKAFIPPKTAQLVRVKVNSGDVVEDEKDNRSLRDDLTKKLNNTTSNNTNNVNNLKNEPTKKLNNASPSKQDTVIEAFKPDQAPKKTWYKKEEFDQKKEKDYYKPEHIEGVEDMINLGTGGLY